MSSNKQLNARLARRVLTFSSVAVLGYFLALCLWLALWQPKEFGPVLLGFIAGALFATALCGLLGLLLAAQLWVFGPELADEDSPSRQRLGQLTASLQSWFAASKPEPKPKPEPKQKPEKPVRDNAAEPVLSRSRLNQFASGLRARLVDQPKTDQPKPGVPSETPAAPVTVAAAPLVEAAPSAELTDSEPEQAKESAVEQEPGIIPPAAPLV